MSYTIEVYRGNQKAEKHLGIYSLYVMFFPQLVAGPIERPQNVLHQFYQDHLFDYNKLKTGLKLIGWGLFKKVVIADRLSIIVNEVYNNPREFDGPALTLATLFFSFQIYCDFSGYSDIALGSAKILGYDLMENFKRPYFSKSISEFWTRWHISLSTWFRDYLYIPLGGNRVPISKWCINIFSVFLISGLWHGASWNFIIWGSLHGLYMIIEKLIKPFEKRTLEPVLKNTFPFPYMKVLLTFLQVSFAWIFFRAQTVDDSLYIVSHLTSGWSSILNLQNLKVLISNIGGKDLIYGLFNILIGFAVILFMEYIHFHSRNREITDIIKNKPTWQRWLAYYGIILAILTVGVFQHQEFIYFQF
jgi:D-alanyl-lipoteichoic acid acyltransferase DltB (MBOAT superfamily)